MRVALIADGFSIKAGTGVARYNQELLAGMVSRGLHVRPIAPRAPGLPFGGAINHMVRMPYIVRRKAGHFDLIHATSPITALAFPVVNKPKVVTYHDLFSLLYKNATTAFHARLLSPLFLRIGKLADRVIAVSSQTRHEIVQHLGIPGDRISVVNYGISEMFRPVETEHRDGYVIGYVGALDRRKAVDYLLRAMHLVNKTYRRPLIKLVICGSKHTKSLKYPALRRLATSLDIDQDVEFRGFVRGEELVKTYNSFDVFVLPSEWEGFGLPILEAQKCGVPVIIREDAHIPAEVSECCLKAHSQEDMADKIYELLTNARLRQAVIEQGLEYSQQFTWERTVRETLRVYQKALS